MQARSGLVAIVLLAVLVSCQEPSSSEIDLDPPAETVAERGVVEIRAEDYAFVAPPTFPSGWVRLRFDNQGLEPHFLILWDLPDGKTFDDYAAEVAKPFQDLYTLYRAGELDQETFFERLIAAIPEWFYSAVPKGGPGFTAAGQRSETIVYLEPGDNYLMECYVRSSSQGDRFHGAEGMLRPLIVTDEPSGLERPEADVTITLSSFELSVEGDLSAGPHVAKVQVLDVPEGFIRHNVHLARLADGRTAEEVALWMNWVDQMLPPAPAAFLGGAGQTVTGRESYVPFNLESGRYAWVSEMFGIQGMVHEFTVE